MPELAGVLETSLYVDDIPRSTKFYRELLQLEPMEADDRFCAFNVAGRQVLLLFKKRASSKPGVIPGGIRPPHDGDGQLHMAFSISAADLDAWQKRLTEQGVAIESKVNWPRGGQSLYFRDPDNHLIELATPGVWKNY
jgi:catechol 2,3-dioxygenase-like lactoylglutathione lyase family enzyme